MSDDKVTVEELMQACCEYTAHNMVSFGVGAMGTGAPIYFCSSLLTSLPASLSPFNEGGYASGPETLLGVGTATFFGLFAVIFQMAANTGPDYYEAIRVRPLASAAGLISGIFLGAAVANPDEFFPPHQEKAAIIQEIGAVQPPELITALN